jgi:uroporphyrinogen-III decarboxylase
VKERKVPWILAIPPEVLCEKAGTILYDYYHSPESRLLTHQRARDYFLDTFDHDIGTFVGTGLTSYWSATLFGAEIEFGGNNQGAVHRRVLSKIDEVRALSVPSPDGIGDLPRYRFLLDQHERMSRLVEGTEWQARFGTFGFQGPFTTATILRGTDIMMDVAMQPELVKELLTKVVEAQHHVMIFSEREFGAVRRSCGMGDDYAGLISPDMYGEFCYPYMKELYDTYGIEGRSLHCETLKRGHHRYLPMLGIDSYDPGNNPDVTIEDIIEECPGLYFTYNLFTVRDMVNRSPDEIRRLCEEYIRRGTPGIMTELTVNTPEENVRSYLDVVRSHAPGGRVPEPGPELPKD